MQRLIPSGHEREVDLKHCNSLLVALAGVMNSGSLGDSTTRLRPPLSLTAGSI